MLKQVEYLPGQNVRLDVAAYYRKSPASREAIEASIEQQMKEVRIYAASRGWRIVAEYTDGGKSGSRDQEKRTELLRLVEDAKAGKFTAVLFWHTNRFARLDIIDLGMVVGALRTAGVHLESVKQGTIDANTKQGRMMLFMTSESDSDVSKNVSGDSLRGRMSVLDAGFWPHGRVPWGFDKSYVEAGTVKLVVPRAEKFQKPHNWKKLLVINAVEAEHIRWIYNAYGRKDTSMRSLARQLTARGIRTPRGDAVWSLRSVVEVLSNPVYAGDATIGVQRGGVKGTFNRAKATSKASVPAIITRELWNGVQARIVERKISKRRVIDGKHHKSSSLSGVLVCGHCGHRLIQKRTNGVLYFICNSPRVRPGCGCKQWRVHETAVLPEIRKLLVESVEWQLLHQLQAQPTTTANADLARLKDEAAQLKKRIDKGAINLLEADSDIFPMLQEKLSEWKAQLTKLQNTVLLAEAKPAVDADLLAWEQDKATLVEIKPGEPVELERMHGGQGTTVAKLLNVPALKSRPESLRSLLHRLGVNVTIWWRPIGERYTLERGLLRAKWSPGDQVTHEYPLTGYKSIAGQKVSFIIHIEKVLDFTGISGTSYREVPLTRAQRQAKYRADHPDRIKASNRHQLEKNREANRARCKAYRQSKTH